MGVFKNWLQTEPGDKTKRQAVLLYCCVPLNKAIILSGSLFPAL